jgi:hypothetical protein
VPNQAVVAKGDERDVERTGRTQRVHDQVLGLVAVGVVEKGRDVDLADGVDV